MSYEYEPLPDANEDIRLIRILPSDGMIRCQLCTCTLTEVETTTPRPKQQVWRKQSSLRYYALSYQWGSSDEAETIDLNGHAFSIHKNLFKFLQQISKSRQREISDGEFLIWIDAISINQSDLAEKAAQVQNMVSIFASAEKVFMWLGEHPHDEVRPYVNLKEIASFLGCVTTFFKVLTWADTISRTDHEEYSFESKLLALSLDFWDESAANSLSYMFGLPYWYRRWIMQEVYVASSLTVLCNENELQFETLCDFYKLKVGPTLGSSFQRRLPWNHAIPRSVIEKIDKICSDIWGLWWHFDKSRFGQLSKYRDGVDGGMSRIADRKSLSSLTKALQDLGGSKCLLVHDHVYALRAFADNPSSMIVDYECSPWRLVYNTLSSQPKFMSTDMMVLIDQLQIVEATPGTARDELLRMAISTDEQSLVISTSPNWRAWDTCAEMANNRIRREYPGDMDHPPFCFPGDTVVDDRPRTLCSVSEYTKEFMLAPLPSSRLLVPVDTMSILVERSPAIQLSTGVESKNAGGANYALDQNLDLYTTSVKAKAGDVILTFCSGDYGLIMRNEAGSNGLVHRMVGSYRKIYLPNLEWLEWSKAAFERYRADGWFENVSYSDLSEAEKIIDFYISARRSASKPNVAPEYTRPPIVEMRNKEQEITSHALEDPGMKLQVSLHDLALYYRWRDHRMLGNWKKDLSV